MARGEQRKHAAPSPQTVAKARRQRASPSRLVNLYQDMTSDQKEKIDSIGFGGLLKIASARLPAGFADWLTRECYDDETSELVLPGRGRIAINSDLVSNVLGIPNMGDEIKYELDVDAMNFMYEKYGIDEGTAPSIDSILERVKANRTADDDFLRSWLMIAVSTFLCPPTGLCISPRCYPAIRDLSCVKKLNWSQFVVDQLKVAGAKMGKRKSFKGFLFVLVLVYLDSLLVDKVQIPDTMPRCAAWSTTLLNKVIKLDTNRDGSFGKIKKKTMLNTAVSQLCSGFTQLLGNSQAIKHQNGHMQRSNYVQQLTQYGFVQQVIYQ